MAKLKMLKAPKRPKQSASVAVKENFLKKLAAVKKENARRKAENLKSSALDKRISSAINGLSKG